MQTGGAGVLEQLAAGAHAKPFAKVPVRNERDIIGIVKEGALAALDVTRRVFHALQSERIECEARGTVPDHGLARNAHHIMVAGGRVAQYDVFRVMARVSMLSGCGPAEDRRQKK